MLSGAFGGDPYLKSVLQWLAASQSGRDMQYFTFNDQSLAASLERLSTLYAGSATVGDVFGALLRVCGSNLSRMTVHEALIQSRLITDRGRGGGSGGGGSGGSGGGSGGGGGGGGVTTASGQASDIKPASASVSHSSTPAVPAAATAAAPAAATAAAAAAADVTMAAADEHHGLDEEENASEELRTPRPTTPVMAAAAAMSQMHRQASVTLLPTSPVFTSAMRDIDLKK